MNNQVNRSGYRSWLRTIVPPLLVATCTVALWQGLIWWTDLPRFILPSPRDVWEAAQRERAVLGKAMLITGSVSVIGLATAVTVGSLLAIIFSQSRSFRLALYPYVLFLQTVPIVAIAPLLIIWCGYETRTVVIITTIISVFPIVSNVTAGLLALDANHSDLFRLYGAGRWTTLWRLRIPNAIGHLALGTRISCGLAVIGTIMGEYFVGTGSQYAGLGSLMSRWQNMQKTDQLMAAVLGATLLGLLIFGFVNLLTATVLRRWTTRVVGTEP